MSNPQRVLVVGGGIAGLATARALRRRGMEPEVAERATDPSSGDPARLAELFGGFAEPVPTILGKYLAAGHEPYFAPIEEVIQEPWVRGRVVPVGDAAHAMSPNMAEGAGMALEDALVLAETVAADRPLAEFEARRRPRVAFVQAQTHRRARTRNLPRPSATRRCGSPVAELWPEFAARGKQAVTVRQVLNHTAGVPGIPLDTTVEDLCDWDKMCTAIADAELWWEPGTKVGYHAYTFGYIVGEFARRATGKPISQLLREEVAGPLGVADELWFGMPVSEHHRLARLEDEPDAAEMAAQMMASMPPDLPMFKAAPPELFPNAAFGNRTDTLAADIPAGGKTSARAIARMYAALLGEVDGVRLLPPERVAEATAVSSSGVDEVFGMPTTWGLGYGIGGPSGDAQGSRTVFGLGGVGGSFACGDTATGLAWAATKNRISNDFSTATGLGQLITGAG